MMKHYLSIKEEYPDCIIFYRLGDFYEMFFEDAKTASAILELTLTGRDCGLEERAPMCGVPHHAADTYIAKLVAAGQKVAICEQLEDAATAKGMVERGVIRVVTAGTVTDVSQLDEKTSNYVAVVYGDEKGVSLSWADITTGEFAVTEFAGEDSLSFLIETLTRVQPAEIIASGYLYKISQDLPVVKHGLLPAFQLYRESQFQYAKGEARLKKQFNVLSLLGLIPEGKNRAVIAAGALLLYLDETQKHQLQNLSEIVFEEKNSGLALDYNAIRNLELVRSMRDGKRYGTLFWLLDRTKTGMGARMLANWLVKPLVSREKIQLRLDGVEELTKSTLIRQGLAELLSSVRDLSRLAGRVSNNNITPRDALALGASLQVLPSLRFQLSTLQTAIMEKINASICDLSELEHMLTSAIEWKNTPVLLKDGGYIADGFNAELDELRKIAKSGVDIINEIELAEREKTGIKNLKVAYNRVFGYYIEVTNSYKELVPYHYVRKQTTVNSERYITEELKVAEEKILGAKEKSIALEAKIFDEIKQALT
ncbi:MAG: DNA mismatch repair protein MutS, partial [Clostridia bacterium]|nr:DNA mismatch repair protein MutS [Clostridia bacterium]